MVDVVHAVRREHAVMAKLLDILERQVAIFDAGDVPDYEIVQAVLDYYLSYPDQYHHPKEDLIYRKLSARNPMAASAVGDLEAEHAELAALTRRLLETVNNVLNESEILRETVDHVARTFIDFSRRHMAREETVFLPAALRSLTPGDWAEIDAQLAELREEGRLRVLRNDILTWARIEQQG